MRELILAIMTLINAQNTGGQFFFANFNQIKKKSGFTLGLAYIGKDRMNVQDKLNQENMVNIRYNTYL